MQSNSQIAALKNIMPDIEKDLATVSEDSTKNASYYRNLMLERYHSVKKMLYVNRPLFTASIGLFFLFAGYIGVLPASWAIFLGVTTMIDDVIITPVLYLRKQIINLFNNHKSTKSWLGLTSILLGYGIGALIGFFFLMHSPFVLSLLPILDGAYGASLIMVLLAATGAIIVAEKFNFNSIYTVGAALLLLPFFPALSFITPGIEIIAAAFLLGGFITSVLSKQVLRLAYKIKYGHSNADGYFYAHSHEKEPTDIDQRQAKIFREHGVNADAQKIRDLRVALLDVIDHIKSQSSKFSDLLGFRQPNSYAYKDRLYLLLNAKNKTDVDNFNLIIQKQERDFLGFHSWMGGTSSIYARASNAVSMLYCNNDKSSLSAMLASNGIQTNNYAYNAHGLASKDIAHRIFAAGGRKICEEGSATAKKAIKEYDVAVSQFGLDRIDPQLQSSPNAPQKILVQSNLGIHSTKINSNAFFPMKTGHSSAEQQPYFGNQMVNPQDAKVF